VEIKRPDAPVPSLTRLLWKAYVHGFAGIVVFFGMVCGLSRILDEGVRWLFAQGGLHDTELLLQVIWIVVIPYASYAIPDPWFMAYDVRRPEAQQPIKKRNWFLRAGETYLKGWLILFMVSAFLVACIGPWWVWHPFIHNDPPVLNLIVIMAAIIVTPFWSWFLAGWYHQYYCRLILGMTPVAVAHLDSNDPH